MKVTGELIRSGMSVNGGWSAAQLALLGVPWPPAGGWKARVIGTEIDGERAEEFLLLKGRPTARAQKRKKSAERKKEWRELPNAPEAKRGKAPRMKEAVRQATEAEPWVRDEAERRGLRLRVSWMQSGKTTTAHWQVETPEGTKLVDYWPGTGSYYCRSTGEKGKLVDWNDVVDLACNLACKTPASA